MKAPSHIGIRRVMTNEAAVVEALTDVLPDCVEAEPRLASCIHCRAPERWPVIYRELSREPDHEVDSSHNEHGGPMSTEVMGIDHHLPRGFRSRSFRRVLRPRHGHPRLSQEHGMTTDQSKFDVGLTHEFLATSYWARGIPRDMVECAIRNSLAFGVFHHQRQDGFGRGTTGYATIAYIEDIFVVPEYRGCGLSKLLMRTILVHPRLQGLRRLPGRHAQR